MVQLHPKMLQLHLKILHPPPQVLQPHHHAKTVQHLMVKPACFLSPTPMAPSPAAHPQTPVEEPPGAALKWTLMGSTYLGRESMETARKNAHLMSTQMRFKHAKLPALPSWQTYQLQNTQKTAQPGINIY